MRAGRIDKPAIPIPAKPVLRSGGPAFLARKTQRVFSVAPTKRNHESVDEAQEADIQRSCAARPAFDLAVGCKEKLP